MDDFGGGDGQQRERLDAELSRASVVARSFLQRFDSVFEQAAAVLPPLSAPLRQIPETLGPLLQQQREGEATLQGLMDEARALDRLVEEHDERVHLHNRELVQFGEIAQHQSDALSEAARGLNVLSANLKLAALNASVATVRHGATVRGPLSAITGELIRLSETNLECIDTLRKLSTEVHQAVAEARRLGDQIVSARGAEDLPEVVRGLERSAEWVADTAARCRGHAEEAASHISGLMLLAQRQDIQRQGLQHLIEVQQELWQALRQAEEQDDLESLQFIVCATPACARLNATLRDDVSSFVDSSAASLGAIHALGQALGELSRGEGGDRGFQAALQAVDRGLQAALAGSERQVAIWREQGAALRRARDLSDAFDDGLRELDEQRTALHAISALIRLEVARDPDLSQASSVVQQILESQQAFSKATQSQAPITRAVSGITSAVAEVNTKVRSGRKQQRAELDQLTQRLEALRPQLAELDAIVRRTLENATSLGAHLDTQVGSLDNHVSTLREEIEALSAIDGLYKKLERWAKERLPAGSEGSELAAAEQRLDGLLERFHVLSYRESAGQTELSGDGGGTLTLF